MEQELRQVELFLSSELMSGKYSGLARPQQQNKHRTEQCV